MSFVPQDITCSTCPCRGAKKIYKTRDCPKYGVCFTVPGGHTATLFCLAKQKCFVRKRSPNSRRSTNVRRSNFQMHISVLLADAIKTIPSTENFDKHPIDLLLLSAVMRSGHQSLGCVGGMSRFFGVFVDTWFSCAPIFMILKLLPMAALILQLLFGILLVVQLQFRHL